MKFLLSFLIPLLITQHLYGQNGKVLEKCLAVFNVQFCSSTQDDTNVLMNLWTVMDTYITVLVPDHCVGLGFNYNWALKELGSGIIVKSFGESKNQSLLFIKGYSIQKGKYTLELMISHSKVSKRKFIKCSMRFKNAPIIAAIAGASVKTIHSGDTVVLDGSYSYKGGNTNIDYNWLAEKVGDPENNLTTSGEITSLTIKGEIGDEWKIRLTVTADNQQSTKYITVKIGNSNTPVIDIICRKNCPETGNYLMLPNIARNLEVVCYKACESIEYYSWNVGNKEVVYVDTFGPKDSQMSVMYKTFYKHEDIVVTVYVNGDSFAKGEILAIAKYIQVGFVKTPGAANCNQESKSPSNLLSVVFYKCILVNDVVEHLMLQHINTGTVIILARNIGPEFYIRASSYGGDVVHTMESAEIAAIDYYYIKSNVSKALPPKYTSTMQLIKDMYSENPFSIPYPNPSRLGLEGRVWQAVQLINVLMPKLFEEETDQASKDFSIEICIRILNDMRKFPTDAALNSMIGILVRLFRPEDELKDRQYALALSLTCEHLALKRKEFLLETNALLHEGMVYQEHTILRQCAVFLMTSNYKRMDVGAILTPPPMEGHPANVEDYPSYDELILDNMREEYMIITNKSIEITMLASYNLIMTRAFGGQPYVFKGEFCQPDKARAIVNIFNETLLFWETSDVTVNTVIVNLHFLDTKGKVSYNMPEIAHLFFNTSEVLKSPFIECSASLPTGHRKFNDTNIPVFRIDMRNASVLRLAFSEIREPIRVVILEARRPTLSDFSESILIRGIHQRLGINPVKHDVWLYMGILPASLAPPSFNTPKHIKILSRRLGNSRFWDKRRFLKGKSRDSDLNATFRISVFSQQCVEWQNNTWFHSDCVVGTKTTDTIVHCECYSIINVAAYSITPNLKRQDMIFLDIVLEHSPRYIPLMFLIGVIGLYCVLVIFGVVRRHCEQQIYYLSDNLSTHNYAYLVRVKTSGNLDAGTTANIVIKIHGEKAKSRPHVLNYPDPDKNLLQCGCDDYFVLTTRRYLGELKLIELWSDCLQIRPTWRCDHVQICDLQKRNWYTFEVHNLFLPIKRYKHYVCVKVGKCQKKVRRGLYLQQMCRIFSFKFGAEHTWNIFSRKNDDSFSYMERVTIILANITMVCAAALFFCCNPHFKLCDAIYDDKTMKPFKVLLYTVLTSLSTFPISIILVIIFRQLTRRIRRKYYYKKKVLPEKLKYVSWTLTCLIIISSSVYVFFMGLGIAVEAANGWITTVMIALVVNIALLENMYIGFVDFFELFQKTGIVYNYENIINESQRQKVYLGKVIPGSHSLRPYMVHLYKPMDKNRYERKRAQITRRFQISKTFKDFTVFIIYFMLLYALVALNLNSYQTIFSEHMKDMMNGQLGGLHLRDVRNTDQLIKYLNTTFIGTLHGNTWYGNYTVTDPGLMTDFQTKFLGVARFRQKRVIDTTCPDTKLSWEIFKVKRCIPPYSMEYENETSNTKKSHLWKYFQPLEAGLTFYFGDYDHYYGGGYIGYAGRNLHNAYYNIKEISNEGWFDKYTRAVFIEFWAYNANTNLFSIVTVCFEFHPTGYVAKTYVIYSLTLIFANTDNELIIISMFLLYCILVFYQLANLMSKIFYQGSKIWKQGAHYLDIIIVTGNLAVIGLHVHKEAVVGTILDQLWRHKNNEFTKYFVAVFYIEIITLCIAVLMCISLLGTWGFLRFGFIFKVFERATKTQAKPLISAFVYSIVMFFPYVIISRILFGGYAEMFRSFYSSIIVVSLLGLDQYPEYNFDEVQSLLPFAGMIFFATYRLWQQVMVSFFIAIITLHYEDSKKFVSKQEKEFSILTYFIEEIKYFYAYVSRKKKYLKGGADSSENLNERETVIENENVIINENENENENIITPIVDINLEPKLTKKFDDDEQSSGVIDVTKNKLQLMSLVCFASLHNDYLRKDKEYLTDNEYDLMQAIVWYYENYNEGERLTYYRMKIDDEKFHVLPKEEVEIMEKITTRLFEPESKSEKKPIKVKPIPDKISLKRFNAICESLVCVDRIMKNVNIVTKK